MPGTWLKNIAHWVEDNTAYLSIPFTWLLPSAYSLCIYYREQGYQVRAGGPAVSLMPDYLNSIAQIGGAINALPRHNPLATFTTRGCIRHCSFCAVPKIEGNLVELPYWEPKPIVCDNNLLASSRVHFDRVVDSLKPIAKIDFNQALDARLLTSHHIDRLRELNLALIRLAWDHTSLESIVFDAIGKLLYAGFPPSKIRVYVLVGYDDTPEDTLYRCQTLKSRGILPNPQRYNPLDTLIKDSYISPNWTDTKLTDFIRYWSRQNWLKKIPFEEYSPTKRRRSRHAR